MDHKLGPTYYRFIVSNVITAPAINSTNYSIEGAVFKVQEVHLSGGSGAIVCQLMSGSAPTMGGTLTKTSPEALGDATIRFSEVSAVGANPFWHNNAVDYGHYLSENSLPMPDWVFIMLGTNDVFWCQSDRDMTYRTDYIKNLNTLIASIKAAGVANVGVLCVPPPASDQDAFGASYGACWSRMRVKRNYVIWNQMLMAEYKNSEADGIYIVPVNTALDSVHCFPVGRAEPVNSRRTDITIQRQQNAVHPVDAGYKQISDAIWAFLKCREADARCH